MKKIIIGLALGLALIGALIFGARQVSWTNNSSGGAATAAPVPLPAAWFNNGDESYGALMRNSNHWEWELTLSISEILLLDVFIGLIVWPRIHRDIKRHGVKPAHGDFYCNDPAHDCDYQDVTLPSLAQRIERLESESATAFARGHAAAVREDADLRSGKTGARLRAEACPHGVTPDICGMCHPENFAGIATKVSRNDIVGTEVIHARTDDWWPGNP